MPLIDVNEGLNFKVPTSGTPNWAERLRNLAWRVISRHDHTGSGKGLQIPSAGIENQAITSAKLARNFGLYQDPIPLSPPTIDANHQIDWNNGMIQTLNLEGASGDVTLSFQNPVQGALYRLWIIQSETPRSITWPESFKWPQGVAPILSQEAGRVDLVEAYFTGTEYRAQWELDFQ